MDETRRIRVGYLRESQDRTGQGKAVARHKRDCERRADEIGWTIDRWFVDNDVSAYGNKKREQYDEMVELVRTGQVDGILFWAMDRVHKDHVLLEQYIALVEQHGIELQSAMEAPFDLNTAAGRRDARSACTAARFESERKSERHRSASKEKAEAGEHNGGLRPFGYVDAARSAVVEHEADAVRGATELLCRGASQAEAVRFMRSLAKTTRGREWTVPKVQRLLLAPSIAGKRAHHGEVVADAAWPPLITWEQYERVRSILNSNKGRGKGRGDRTRSYLLSGIAVCGRCLANGETVVLIAQPYRGQRAYRCPQASRTVNGPRGCGGSRVLADDLDEYVTERAMGFAVDPDRIAFDKASAERRSAKEAEVRAKLDALRLREDNLADAIEAQWHVARERLQRRQAELLSERAYLESQLAELTSPLEPALLEGSTAREARRRFDALTVGQQRAALVALLDPECPVVVRSVTDAGSRELWRRVSVAPRWAGFLERARRATPTEADERSYLDQKFTEGVYVAGVEQLAAERTG
jgi:site-specific DNA recombinase